MLMPAVLAVRFMLVFDLMFKRMLARIVSLLCNDALLTLANVVNYISVSQCNV